MAQNPLDFIGFLLRNIFSQPSRQLGGRRPNVRRGGLITDPGRPRQRRRRRRTTQTAAPSITSAFANPNPGSAARGATRCKT